MRCQRRGGLASAALFAAALAALTACQTVQLGDPPADINACRPSQTYFATQVWPMALSQDYMGRHCYDAQCHGAASSNALKLTSDVPAATDATGNLIIPIPLTLAWADNYRSAAEQMNCSNVASSALLARPAGLQTHGGGMLFSATGTEADVIKGWVGAPRP